MYAAGYLEGLMTCVRISQYHANNHKLLLKDEALFHSLTSVKGQLAQEVQFMKDKANLFPHLMSEEPEDSYWKHSRYILFQMWGITDGFNFGAKHFGVHELELSDMLVINSGAEMAELMMAYTPANIQARFNEQTLQAQMGQVFLQRGENHTKSLDPLRRQRRRPQDPLLEGKPGEDPLDDAHWEKRLAKFGHCSAFIRVTDGNSDLMIGHTTWNDYSQMTRIWKYYNFPLPGADTMSMKVSMSSYPAAVTSMDDFYVLDSGLAVMETSLELINLFNWDKITDFPGAPHIPNFVHVMAVNRLAKTSAHWARLYSRQNTGTYNAQWMVVDYNNFVSGQPVADNTLWLIETIPGMIHKEDISSNLRHFGYWASFNRPYFDDVREESGQAAAQKSHGDMYSWHDAPRAKIFRNTVPGVEGLFDMRTLMNRNLYPYAGVEPNEPGHEISARMDLSPTQPIPNGGIDAKVTNRCLFKVQNVQAISGPTHANQPAFKWINDAGRETFPGWPHNGQPDVWKFGWVQMTPAGSANIVDSTDC
jgi:hypothetical protein